MTRPPRGAGLRALLTAALLLLATGVATSPASTQEPARRGVEVPVHPDANVGVIDASLRARLGLFADVDGFVSATLLRIDAEDRWLLEIVSRRGGQVVREWRTLSAADLNGLRGRIDAALQAAGATRVVDREGRGGLVLTSTGMGLAYYGWALPEALDVHGDRGRLAGYLLTSGASFVVPYLLTRDAGVTRAQRNAYAWGATRGVAVGFSLGDIVTGSDRSNTGDRARLGGGVLGSVGLGIAGYHLAGALDHDVGRTAYVGVLGDFGLATGFGTAYALGLFDNELLCDLDVCYEDDDDFTVSGHLVALGMGAAGIALGTQRARDRHLAPGDARMLQSAGLLGAQAVTPLAWAAFGDDTRSEERAFAGSLALGAIAGLALGDRYGLDGRLSAGDGLLVLAGHVAGGLGALGLTYLIDDGNSDAELYLTTSAVGSLAGSLFTYRAVRNEAPMASPRDGDGARFDLQPLALFSPREAPAPFLTIRF